MAGAGGVGLQLRAAEGPGAELHAMRLLLLPPQLNDEQSERLAALEREFSTKRRPVYTDRAAIIAQVPKFWQRALVSHPQIHTMVTDDDVEVLGYVSEVRGAPAGRGRMELVARAHAAAAALRLLGARPRQ